MALSKEFLKNEAAKAEAAIKACSDGIEINQIVLDAVRREQDAQVRNDTWRSPRNKTMGGRLKRTISTLRGKGKGKRRNK